MPIKMTEDLGAPVVVALANIVTKEVQPDWNEWAHYILTAVGYGAGFMNFGGNFVKNLGVASLSGTIDHIYTRVKSGTVTRSPAGRMNYRPVHAPVHAPVQRSYQPEFEAVTPSAF